MSEFTIGGPAPMIVAPTYQRAAREAQLAGLENWVWVNTIDYLTDECDPRVRHAFTGLVDDLIRNHAEELFDAAEQAANGDGEA